MMDWLSPEVMSGATFLAVVATTAVHSWRLSRIEKKLDGPYEPIPARVAVLESEVRHVKEDVKELQKAR